MNQSIQKIIYFPITKIVLGILFCLSALVGIQNFILKPTFYAFLDSKNVADPIIHSISLIVLLSSYYYFFRFYEKREIKELSLVKIPKELFGGFAIGFIAISASISILYFLGHYEFISISIKEYPVKLFTTLLSAALLEDLFIRGLLIRELENWIGTYKMLLIAMAFELLHIFNPNSNLISSFFDIIWGFTMAMLYVYSKRIWLPFFFHVGWNFAQPFYGSNLTGLKDMGAIIQSKWSGPELLSGGNVGIESSIFTIAILLTIGLYLFYISKKEGKFINPKIIKS